jgi:hypothetical protein
MSTYFLLYPSTTRVLHTETAALGLSISAVEAAINDVFGNHSDGATSQNLAHDLAVDCFKCGALPRQNVHFTSPYSHSSAIILPIAWSLV